MGQEIQEIEEINVRVSLHGDQAKKFAAIKEKLGVSNNTEVIRILLNKEFSLLQEENSS